MNLHILHISKNVLNQQTGITKIAFTNKARVLNDFKGETLYVFVL